MAILPGRRIRDNGVFGAITDNPLTIGATTFNSPTLDDLSVVSGNHAIVTLDPLREFGDPEIVMVTIHTAAATVATIQRGMFGTVARAHPQGTLWVHAATNDDFVRVVTSGTRPTDQYDGQFILETDTDTVQIHNGSSWIQALQFGAWTPWVPTFTGFTLGNGVINRARYSRTGRTINFELQVTLGSTSVMGDFVFTLPVSRNIDGMAIRFPIGIVNLNDTGTVFLPAFVVAGSASPSTEGRVLWLNASINNALTALSTTQPFTWANTDILQITGSYEAAS